MIFLMPVHMALKQSSLFSCDLRYRGQTTLAVFSLGAVIMTCLLCELSCRRSVQLPPITTSKHCTDTRGLRQVRDIHDQRERSVIISNSRYIYMTMSRLQKRHYCSQNGKLFYVSKDSLHDFSDRLLNSHASINSRGSEESSHLPHGESVKNSAPSTSHLRMICFTTHVQTPCMNVRDCLCS